VKDHVQKNSPFVGLLETKVKEKIKSELLFVFLLVRLLQITNLMENKHNFENLSLGFLIQEN